MSRACFDPITLEILWSKVIAALDEAATALVRTAFSTILREANDFACVLTDTEGQSIGQSVLSLPSFLNTIPVTIRHFLKHYPPETLLDGDVLRLDVPGGSGYGDPKERPQSLRRRDVFNGYVVPERSLES